MTDHPKLDAAADRVEGKLLSGYVVPLLCFLLLAVSGFAFKAIMTRLDGIDVSNTKQETSIGSMSSDIRDINTRLNMGVIATVNDNKATIAEHEKRIQVLERAVNVK